MQKTDICRNYRINRNRKLTYIDAELSLWQECDCSNNAEAALLEETGIADTPQAGPDPAVLSPVSIVYS